MIVIQQIYVENLLNEININFDNVVISHISARIGHLLKNLLNSNTFSIQPIIKLFMKLTNLLVIQSYSYCQ